MGRTQAKPKAPPEDLVEVFEEEDVEQGSEEWHRLRLGLPTASVFSAIMAEGEGLTREALLYRKAGEILSGEVAEGYENDAMRGGRIVEADALADYAFTRDVEVRRVGFVRRTITDPLAQYPLVVGCSPDGLVGEDGIVQVKSMRPDLLVRLIDSGRPLGGHKWQCQGEMWVLGRQWCDLMAWCRTPAMTTKFPVAPVYRVERMEAEIARLRNAVEIFAHDLRTLVARVRARGGGR